MSSITRHTGEDEVKSTTKEIPSKLALASAVATDPATAEDEEKAAETAKTLVAVDEAEDVEVTYASPFWRSSKSVRCMATR
jgi:hypothetical protein